jgi:polysaccharide pyruvyl transferase WcaK-like protein
MALTKLRTYGPAVKLPMKIACGVPGAKRFIHVGVHNSANRNSGDTLLFSVVRRAFDALIGPIDWELQQVWSEFDIELAEGLNDDVDGIVIGGGGLLLRDQAGSDISNSGWQWNSSVSALQALKVPIIAFAIGYNRFRGQADFDPIFTKHIQMVVEKSGFFGLRNSGSIRALGNYLAPRLNEKIRRQYCPTTLIWQLYPEYREMAEAHAKKNQRVFAFNAAFDRVEMRFGADQKRILDKLAQAVHSAENRGWKIVVTAHKTMDRKIEPYLDMVGVNYETADLTDANPDEIMEFYSKVDFAFGMRGHAQMIPFGLRRPIMSIISHDKMRFLLEDIDRLEWGVEIDSPDLKNNLVSALARVESEKESVDASIANAQSKVWEETLTNFELIDKVTSAANKAE